MHNKDCELGAISFAFRLWKCLQLFLDILSEFRKGIPVNNPKILAGRNDLTDVTYWSVFRVSSISSCDFELNRISNNTPRGVITYNNDDSSSQQSLARIRSAVKVGCGTFRDRAKRTLTATVCG